MSNVLVVRHDGVDFMQDGDVGSDVVAGKLAVEGTKHIYKSFLVIEHHCLSSVSGVGREDFFLVAHDRKGSIRLTPLVLIF